MKNLCFPLILTFLFIILFCGKVFAASCTDDGSGNIICNVVSGQDIVDGLSGLTLTKNGAGKTVLTGITTIYNNIDINAGVLYINGILQSNGVINVNDGILKGNSESLSVNIYNNSKTIFQQDYEGTFLSAISGTGDVEKRGTGTLILAGNTGQQNFTGAFDIIEGALQVNSVSLTRDANVSSGAFIIFDQQDGPGIYANIISGDGAFIKRGLDALTLTGQNTYSGGTYIEDSSGLIIGADSVLGAQVSDITLNGGKLTINNNVSTARNFNLLNPMSNDTLLPKPNYITVGNDLTYGIDGVLSGGSFVKTGLGTLVLTAQNTHAGGTQVAEGILSVGTQNSLGAGFLAITDDGVFKPLNSMDLNLNVYLRDNGKFHINGGDTLNVSGLLAGTGALIKDGAGTMSVMGGMGVNIYKGGVQVLDGILQGNTDSLVGNINVSAGARLDFAQNFDGQYSGDITAAPSSAIIKSGAGSLELAGNNTFAIFNINEGIAAVMSSFSGSVDIANQAAFVVGGDASGSINNSGNLYFLTSKDINFEGNITAAAGSMSVMKVAEGQIYKLSLTNSGNLDISSGASLKLAAQGTYVAPQTFELINYDGTLSGSFDNVFVADSKRITAELDYSNPRSIYITLSRLLSNHSALQGLKTNQKAVAGAVDAASAVPSEDFDFVLNAAEALPLFSRARALDQLGGLIYANVTTLNSFETLKNNTYLHLNKTLPEGELSDNLWIEYSSKYLNVKENDNSGDLRGFSNGAVLGLDKSYSESLRGGLVFSYTHHDMKHNGLEKLDGNEVHAVAYALLKLYGVDLKSVLTAGYRESDISRNLSFAGRYAEGRLKSFGINFDLELSVLFVDILGVELYPFAGLSSYLESRNSFAESGAGEANLYFGGDSVFYSAFNAGLELRRRANSLAYYAGFGAKRTFNNPDMTLNIYNQDFTIKPFDVGTVFSLKAGAVKKFSDLVSLYGGAEAELNADYTNISFNLGMRSYW